MTVLAGEETPIGAVLRKMLRMGNALPNLRRYKNFSERVERRNILLANEQTGGEAHGADLLSL